MQAINAKNFDELVLGAPELVLVIFTAKWCSACPMSQQILDAEAKEYKGRLVVYKVDSEENPSLAERYAVRGIPSLLFLRDGKEVDRLQGSQTKAGFNTAIERNLR